MWFNLDGTLKKHAGFDLQVLVISVQEEWHKKSLSYFVSCEHTNKVLLHQTEAA